MNKVKDINTKGDLENFYYYSPYFYVYKNHKTVLFIKTKNKV